MSEIVVEDPVWLAILADHQLENARRKLSLHEIRLIVNHATRPSSEGVGEAWRSMSEAPRDGSEILICNDRGQFVVMFDDTWGSTGDEEGGWWMVSDGKEFERPLRGDTPYGWKPLGKALNKGDPSHG